MKLSRISSILVPSLASFVISIGSVDAATENFGFESGLDGWSTFGITGTSSDYMGYSAQYGSSFGFVETGAGQNIYSMLSHTFSLAAGSTISGTFAFLTDDYMPYNDSGLLTISNGISEIQTLISSSVSEVGDFGETGWLPFSYEALTSGLYTLTLAVADDHDDVVPSYAFLDVDEVVPVPGPVAGAGLPVLLGFVAAGYFSRRRRPTGDAS